MDFSGQTLDGKYQIEGELGRGGMGTVYLATHLGTERPVAIKIISPQYMQRVEFVERFRREARAAGRLRHPNVVNVTDFGFSNSPEGQVAYLVMEYLDGCTLGEILDEEKNLPVSWTLDIIEQVCSAVHAAHEQGIIHRDLKPDNIWLEPNQRGGYTVKVLDFGIAKLEGHVEPNSGQLPQMYRRSTHTLHPGQRTTIGDASDETQFEAVAGTVVSEAATLVQTNTVQESTVGMKQRSPGQAAEVDAHTEINSDEISGDRDATYSTKLMSETDLPQTNTTGRSLHDRESADLTRVGAVLGTPLYMSPEQCRGGHLDHRSDIYSLGVIAYQMLSGAPPFVGDFQSVMESHKSEMPRPLKAKYVRRKMGLAIDAALDKDPEKRPQSAEAFASVLRARSEGIFALLRRALVIYSEHLPKFLILTGFLSLPMIVLTVFLLVLSFLKVSDIIPEPVANFSLGVVGAMLSLASAFSTILIVGSISWIVTQYLAVPLRPVRIRPALAQARKKVKRFAAAGVLTAIAPFVTAAAGSLIGLIGFAVLMAMMYPITRSGLAIAIGAGAGAGLFGLVGFFTAYLMLILVAPIVMMENTGVRDALRRSVLLVRRSLATSFGAVAIMFIIPLFLAGTISYVVNISAKAFDPQIEKPSETVKSDAQSIEKDADPVEPLKQPEPNINFRLGTGVAISTDKKDVQSRIKHTVLESLIQILWLPMQILVFSFSAIIVALLYLKTRLAGGESMNDLIERFEDDGRPRKKWQERVRQRLIQSGRTPSNS